MEKLFKNTKALSIEQMRYLASLGLDTSDASMIWVWEAEDGDWTCISRSAKNYYWDCMTRYAGYDLPEYISAYTLQDIWEKLLKSIMGYELQMVGNCIGYYHSDYTINGSSLIDFSSKNILEATGCLLVWCIENNYVKLI